MARPRLPQNPAVARADDKLCPRLVGNGDAGAVPKEDGAVEGVHGRSLPPPHPEVRQFAGSPIKFFLFQGGPTELNSGN